MAPRKIAANTLLTIASLAVVGALVVAIDRVAGRFLPSNEMHPGLLFAPHTAAFYDTIEFQCTVYTNNLGIRGNDTTVKKTRALRVAAIGDSFTLGWGVEIGDTWISRIETALRAEGRDLEILNLGVPGYGPGQYADVAERVLPILQPDVVLVELLQNDDFEQSEKWRPLEGPAKRPPSDEGEQEARGSRAQALVRRYVPNLVRVAREFSWGLAPSLGIAPPGGKTMVRERWKRQSREFIAKLSESDRGTFERMTNGLNQAFVDGRLNPAALHWLYPNAGKREKKPESAEKPVGVVPPAEGAGTPGAASPPARDPAWQMLDADSPLMLRRTEACARHVQRIARAAAGIGARTVVVAIPESSIVSMSGWYVLFDPTITEAARQLRDAQFTSTAPIVAVQRAADRAGVPVIQVTEAFRTNSTGRNCYYPYDGHFTPEGHRLFAELLLPALKPYLDPAR